MSTGIQSTARERNKAGNKKLAKLLGEDSLASAVPITPRPSLPPVIQTPWYLGSDYGPGEIVYDDKGGVKAGTLRAFIERLTSHVSTGQSFLSLSLFWLLRTYADMLRYQNRHFCKLFF